LDQKSQQIALLRIKTSRSRPIDWITPAGKATAALASGPQKGTLFPSRSLTATRYAMLLRWARSVDHMGDGRAAASNPVATGGEEPTAAIGWLAPNN
jgi:hypothetical protein